MLKALKWLVPVQFDVPATAETQKNQIGLELILDGRQFSGWEGRFTPPADAPDVRLDTGFSMPGSPDLQLSLTKQARVNRPSQPAFLRPLDDF